MGGSISAKMLTARISQAGSVEALAVLVDRHGPCMNHIHLSAALVQLRSITRVSQDHMDWEPVQVGRWGRGESQDHMDLDWGPVLGGGGGAQPVQHGQRGCIVQSAAYSLLHTGYRLQGTGHRVQGTRVVVVKVGSCAGGAGKSQASSSPHPMCVFVSCAGAGCASLLPGRLLVCARKPRPSPPHVLLPLLCRCWPSASAAWPAPCCLTAAHVSCPTWCSRWPACHPMTASRPS